MNNQFKDNNFKNHILNEFNIPITIDYIESLFTKYDFKSNVKNIENYNIAMTHKSYLKKSIIQKQTEKLLLNTEPISNENKKKAMNLQNKDYEVFEYKGDALIHYALSQYLCNRYENENIDFLTKLRSKLECGKMLSLLSKKLGLHRYVIIARNMEYDNARNIDIGLTEDIFEAFMNAIFIENSYESCKIFLINILEEEVDFAEVINYDNNYKDMLSQHCKKNKIQDPTYCDSKITITIDEKNICIDGFGKNKSETQQDAAKNVLIYLGVISDNNNNNNNNNNNDNNNDDLYCDTGTGANTNDFSENKQQLSKIFPHLKSIESLSHQYHDGDYKNHILNENNKYINENILNDIFEKFNFDHIVKNIENFRQAMVHVSYLELNAITENTDTILKNTPPIDKSKKKLAIPLQKKNGERFVWLGNALIHFVLTNYICDRYPEKDQGFFTILRSKLESAPRLSIFAKKLGLMDYAIIAKNIEICDGRQNDVTLSKNIFEGFIGALSEEITYKQSYCFIVSLIEYEFDLPELLKTEDNYKNILSQYWNAKYGKYNKNDKCKLKLKYIETNLCQETKLFTINIEDFNGNIIGTGKGYPKIKAEQCASYDALVKLNKIQGNTDNTDSFYGESDNEIP